MRTMSIRQVRSQLFQMSQKQQIMKTYFNMFHPRAKVTNESVISLLNINPIIISSKFPVEMNDNIDENS